MSVTTKLNQIEGGYASINRDKSLNLQARVRAMKLRAHNSKSIVQVLNNLLSMQAVHPQKQISAAA